MIKALLGTTILGCPTCPEESSTAVLFLASERATIMDGPEMVADGGYAMGQALRRGRFTTASTTTCRRTPSRYGSVCHELHQGRSVGYVRRARWEPGGAFGGRPALQATVSQGARDDRIDGIAQ